MGHISEDLVRELEVQAGSMKGEKARVLRKKVETALADAKANGVGTGADRPPVWTSGHPHGGIA